MKILITGVSGLVGRGLAQALAGRGHSVVGTVYSGSPPPGCARIFRWSLNDRIEPEMLEGVEVVVHAIHDPRAEEEDVVAAVSRLGNLASEAGAVRQIFLGSLSSKELSLSAYGRQKFRLEQFFLSRPGSIIVRPGLVIGPGGVFARMRGTLRSFPVFPIIDRGSSNVSFIGLDDLICCLVSVILAPAERREYNLFYSQPIQFGQMLRRLARMNGWPRLFLNMPSSWILLGIRVCEALRLPLPVKKENVLGLSQNSDHPYSSCLGKFGLKDASFEDCYRRNFG